MKKTEATSKQPHEGKEPELAEIEIAQIRFDDVTYPREHINEDAVHEYSETMKKKVRFPEIEVYRSGGTFWLSDGRHRLEARKMAGMTTIWAAQSVAQLELDNYNQAQALRVDFNQRFSDLLRAASRAPAQRISGGRTAHDALAVLHTAVLRDLQSRSRDLARLTTYTPQSWQPALYISYRLFGTVGFTDEILAMNRHVEHPLLVPPGVPLRIIRH